MSKINKSKKINNLFDWVIYIIGYALVLLLASLIFDKSFFINTDYYGLWYIVAAIIIYLLNKTIKPLLVWLTLPITGLTMGLFYPFINVIILYLTDLVLRNNFLLKNIIMTLLIAIFISITNIIMQKFVVNLLVRKD